jgi:hypothetical protein
MNRTGLGLLLGAMVFASPVVAQTNAPAQASAATVAHPDFTGFWSLERDQHPFDEEMIAKLPPNTVVLDDTGFVEFPQGEFGGLKLKPEAAAVAAKWKPEDEMTLARVCAAPSVVYSIQGPFPFEIYQTPELIVFKYEYFDQVRLIFMDGRSHPPADAPHTKVGHSVGHWEGGELVVETTHLAPATITNNGLDHSSEIRVIERYKLSEDGKRLKATQWFEDPQNLENNGARYIQWELKPGNYVYPYDCDPTFALEYASASEGDDGAQAAP